MPSSICTTAPARGSAAEAAFDRVHRDHETPEVVPQVSLPAEAVREGAVWLPRLLVAAGLADSNAEAKRTVAQGGVRLDGTVLDDPDAELPLEEIVGKTPAGRTAPVRAGHRGGATPRG